MSLTRRAAAADLPSIHRLRESARRPYPPGERDHFQRQLWGAGTYHGRNVLVAPGGGPPLGYLSYVERAVRESGDFYVWHFGAAPGARGARAGRDLFESATDIASSLGARRVLTACPPGDRWRQRRLRAAGFELAYDLYDLRVEPPYRFAPPRPAGDYEFVDWSKIDAHRFLRIYNACFSGTWNSAKMRLDEARQLLGDPRLDRRGSFLAMRRERYVGFAVNHSHRRQGQRFGELESLGVLPSERGRGLGAFLLRLSLRAQRYRRSAWVELRVAEPNVAALTLYRRAGFQRHGRVHMYAIPLAAPTP